MPRRSGIARHDDHDRHGDDPRRPDRHPVRARRRPWPARQPQTRRHVAAQRLHARRGGDRVVHCNLHAKFVGQQPRHHLRAAIPSGARGDHRRRAGSLRSERRAGPRRAPKPSPATTSAVGACVADRRRWSPSSAAISRRVGEDRGPAQRLQLSEQVEVSSIHQGDGGCCAHGIGMRISSRSRSCCRRPPNRRR